MDDKSIMEGMLLTSKGVCDLYLHGSMESSNPDVHKVFCTALNESMCMQDTLYKKMSEKGWYQQQNVQQQYMQQVKQKFSGNV